ncbi:helix-turn-helix transcriptional regulator [Streptomyces spinoverrucosus]|uniref:helix-turn-helix transcriptional regulator n=1 Tax=Streptomyces spinoverrucosus TaxID=284043 RepID=UPI001E4E93EF|nr:helix-turn-helix transcriptional regulator [Streptomyces spinoverrucosus]
MVTCLLHPGLLRPDMDDMRRLRPLNPAAALSLLLRNAAEDIAKRRQAETRLAEAFGPLLVFGSERLSPAEPSELILLKGLGSIKHAIAEAMTSASSELLAMQPYNGQPPAAARLAKALDRDQALFDRGDPIGTTYQHTQRHIPAVVAHYEQLNGDAEARTLNQVTDRLLVVDRTVAFIHANKDRTLALETCHSTQIGYFTITFDRLGSWQRSCIWRQSSSAHPSGHHPLPASHREPAGRAQLGYLIGQSGILDQEG